MSVHSAGSLHTTYLLHLIAQVGHYICVTYKHRKVAMKHFVLGLDVKLADVDSHVHRYHLYDLLKYAESVDTLHSYIGKELVGLLGPLRIQYSPSVTCLQHLCAGTRERMQLHIAVVVYPSHYIIAGNGAAAIRYLKVVAILATSQNVGFLHVDGSLGGRDILVVFARLLSLVTFERTEYL